MKKATFLLSVIVISISFHTYCQTNETQSSRLLDSTDFRILISKKKIRMFEMTGSPVDSAMQNKKSIYIYNYLVHNIRAIDNSKLTRYILPLLDCKTTITQVPKCTYLAKYCIEVRNNKAKLYLFFSDVGACENLIKVIKLNTLSRKESHMFADSNQFVGLF